MAVRVYRPQSMGKNYLLAMQKETAMTSRDATLGEERKLVAAISDAVKCMNVPEDVKRSLAAIVKCEMQKRWECDDDVIDSFMFVAALMWVKSGRDRLIQDVRFLHKHTYTDAEGPELRAQNERCHRMCGALLREMGEA